MVSAVKCAPRNSDWYSTMYGMQESLPIWYTPIELVARLRFIEAIEPNAPSASRWTSAVGSALGSNAPARFMPSSSTVVNTKWQVVRQST